MYNFPTDVDVYLLEWPHVAMQVGPASYTCMYTIYVYYIYVMYMLCISRCFIILVVYLSLLLSSLLLSSLCRQMATDVPTVTETVDTVLGVLGQGGHDKVRP